MLETGGIKEYSDPVVNGVGSKTKEETRTMGGINWVE